MEPLKKNKVLLFYNPNSGNGMFKNNLDYIIERFQARGHVIIPVRAARGKILKRLLSEIDQEEYKMIIVAGGDGTINICVNAMIAHDIYLPLAIFPSGTANDFASYFEMPEDIDEMIDVALEGYTVPADVGVVNGKYFVNVAALGNVVDVSQKTDPVLKNTLGRFAYYLKGASEFTDLKPIRVKLTAGENVYEEDMFFMIVMNGTSAGGFKNVSPESEINDGLLNVVLFRKMPILEMVPLGIKILRGLHIEDSNVLSFKTANLIIESDEFVPTDVDGEHGEKLPLTFDVMANRLEICVTKAERDYYERFVMDNK